MPSFLIEMLGDGDTDLKDFAVKHAAERGWVAQVTLGPDDRMADYALSCYSEDDDGAHVLLTRWDEDTAGAYINPDGAGDVRRVRVDDIWELRIY